MSELMARVKRTVEFHSAVVNERKLRRALVIWRAVALVGIGYVAKDIIKGLGWL